jgi:hypothetical protein
MSETTSENNGNIDHLLTGVKNEIQPEAPENQTDEEPVLAEAETDDYEVAELSPSEEESEKIEQTEDEYGNTKDSEKRYTETEVNERINAAVRERLARVERNIPAENAQIQKQTKDGFEYNENSNETWQQQLESFVEQTVSKMGQKQSEQARLAKEQQAQSEFEIKFQTGMSKFKDFIEVVQQMPFTDAMTLATRSMKDPAAFIYAATKRAPDEIKRIAAIPDQYAQMVEMGKLEERMRKTKSTTNAPRPLSKTKEDAISKPKAEQGNSIEDQIYRSEQKKLAQLNARRRR